MNIIFTTDDVSVPEGAEQLLQKAAKATLDTCGVTDNVQVGVKLCTDEHIKSINKEFREIDKSTDVLSFPMLDLSAPITDGGEPETPMELEIDPETGEMMLGDIVISVETASRQAEEYGHSLEREMAYLLVHGMLHLLGYDHMEESDKKIMRQSEEIILNAIGLRRED